MNAESALITFFCLHTVQCCLILNFFVKEKSNLIKEISLSWSSKLFQLQSPESIQMHLVGPPSLGRDIHLSRRGQHHWGWRMPLRCRMQYQGFHFCLNTFSMACKELGGNSRTSVHLWYWWSVMYCHMAYSYVWRPIMNVCWYNTVTYFKVG